MVALKVGIIKGGMEGGREGEKERARRGERWIDRGREGVREGGSKGRGGRELQRSLPSTAHSMRITVKHSSHILLRCPPTPLLMWHGSELNNDVYLALVII